MPARDPWLDNAKMTLVTLVVVGHGWTLLPANTFDDQVYDFLYFWHMPAFVFVTGYLSRHWTYSRTRLYQLVRTVAVPYVVFESALALFRIYVGGEHFDEIFVDPHWPLWYLSALFVWRLATPVLRRLPLPVVVATVVSLLAGLGSTEALDLYRVMGFLPFFVLGLQMTPERLELLRRPAVRAAAVLVLGATLVLARFLDQFASSEWLYYRASYDELGVSALDGVATRAVLLVVGLLAAASFLALVPRRGGWFTAMGSATLVVYLFHGFAVKGAEYAGFMGWADAHPAQGVLLVVLGGVAVALALAAPPVAGRLQHVVDPLGYAERHAKHAVDLTVAAVEEPPAPVVEVLPVETHAPTSGPDDADRVTSH